MTPLPPACAKLLRPKAALPLIAGLLIALPAGPAPAQEEEWDGLPAGEGREEVYYNCTACHSLMLVQQQGMSRKRWADTLDWMVEEQGMAALEPEVETQILDYLAEHYGEDRASQ